MLKKFWPHFAYVALIALLLVFGASLYSKSVHDYAKQAEELSKLADTRVVKVAKALEDERKAHEEILNRMQQEFDKNREDYERKIKDLEEKKKKDVNSFVDKHGEDPSAMAEELSKSMGFKVFNAK